MLPKRGQDWQTLKRELEARKQSDADWRGLRTTVFVFNAGEDVMDVAKSAYSLYQSENGLGSGSAFPSLARMESEVVAIGLDLLDAPASACGNMTSGGSESIFLAVKTCRDQVRAGGGDTVGSEVLVPRSAHPAFDKAAGYLDLKVTRIPVDSDFRADIGAMRAAISRRTIMIVGSAPCFPYGVIDPIEDLGEIAEQHNLWLHVDACVGGYFAPFARLNGIDLPAFDFSLPAVRSISADLHKYGYAAKGASTIFHRSEEQRRHQLFSCDQWPVGTMETPSTTGTRPGGAIAAAWAVLHYLGESGYREKTQQVIEARERLQSAIEGMPSLKVVADPQLGLIAYTSPTLDIYAVSELMARRGWVSPLLDEPKAIHLMLSPQHLTVIDEYIADLVGSVEHVSQTNMTSTDVTARYN